MIFNKIFHFVKGYVIIRLAGFYIERFLYICAKRGIKLFRIGKRTDKSLVMCIGISDFHRVRDVAFKTGTRIRIIKKCGLPFFINKIKRRYFLIIGLMLVVCMMFASSQFIWTIEIKGTDAKTANDIAVALDKAGLYIGSFKPSLIDGTQMKNIIMNNTDNLVWAWVYIKGTKACVEYKEGIRPPLMVDKSLPCDIVALKDGIIYSIVEKNGEKRVAAGDTVLAGDLLIAGTIQPGEGIMKTVHASGEAEAVTSHKRSGEYKLFCDKKIKTGRVKHFNTVKLFSKCFDLFFSENVGFEEYIVEEKLSELKIGKDKYLGIGIYKKTYNEITIEKTPVPYDIAVEKGRNELEELIAKEILPSSRLIEKEVTHEKIDEETVKVTVEMSFIEKIGKQVPIIVESHQAQ